jgi:hypothetical protein
VQNQPFKFGPQAAAMAAIAALALALPIAMVVWTLVPKSKKDTHEAPGELRKSLEAIADSNMKPAGLDAATLEARLLVPDVPKASGHLRELVRALGGTCVDAAAAAGHERLLIALPPGAYGEFLRRAELLTGGEMPDIATDAPEPLLSIELAPASKP